MFPITKCPKLFTEGRLNKIKKINNKLIKYLFIRTTSFGYGNKTDFTK